MDTRNEVRRLVNDHLKMRPAMQVVDVYKLLFQGVYGVGHLLSKDAKSYLLDEAAKIRVEDHQEEKLIESISPDGEIIRVNLRPFLRKKLSLTVLFEAMIRSNVDGDADTFLDRWRSFVDLVETGELPFSKCEVKELDIKIKPGQIKPMHHSQKYREEYYPSYRVIKLSELIKSGIFEL